MFFFIFTIILGRTTAILITSKLSNYSRTSNIISSKQQFFLVFAGVRGAMAYALAIKSLSDYKNTGKLFLIITLIFTGFSMIYSSLFLDCVLRKCDLIVVKVGAFSMINGNGNGVGINNGNSNINGINNSNCFVRLKFFVKSIHEKYLLNYVIRSKDKLLSDNIEGIITEEYERESRFRELERERLRNYNYSDYSDHTEIGAGNGRLHNFSEQMMLKNINGFKVEKQFEFSV